MLKTTIKGLVARKKRLALVAVAVTLATAFMSGTLVLTDTIGKTFDDLFADVYKNTDGVVRAESEFDGPSNFGAQRGRVDASLVDVIAAVDGVKLAEGSPYGYARLVGRNGKAIGNPEMGAPTVGASWSDVPELNPFRLASGEPPRAADEVVIDAKSAKDGDLRVGDTTMVLVRAGPHQVRIAGIAKFGTADSPGGASFTLFRPDVAQQLVAEPGKFDAISLLAEPGVSQADLVARVAKVLPGGVEAITGAAATDESQSEIRKAFSFFNMFMMVFAAVALVVGGFMIFNTFSITVAQRTRENGLLRALGASRRQVLGAVLVEALAVAVLASVVGLALGVLVARGFSGLFASFGMEIQTGDMVLSTQTAVLSLVAGIAMTLLAATSPPRKAAKVSPIAAMHAETIGSTGYGSKERVMVGVLVLVTGVGLLLAGLFAEVGNAIGVVGIGVLLTFFGVSVLARTISLPISRVISMPLPRLRGPAGRLARENAMRNPKRTAASASALMIGVGLVGFITILAASAKASTSAAIARTVAGDVMVTAGASIGGGVDPGLAQRLTDLPEVAAATGVRQAFAEVNGKAIFLGALDRETGPSLVDLKAIEGSVSDLGVDALAVHEDVASERDLKVGDPVNVRFKDTGIKTMRVALVFEEKQLGDYVIGREAYDANFADRFDARVFVKAAPGVTPAQALAAGDKVVAEYPGAEAFDQSGYKKEQGKWVDQMLGLIYVLLLLAVVIALLGIGNTLALAIYERTRELGVLRAVGMTRSQLRSTIRWESVIIALQGTALGLVIGLFFAWALVGALEQYGIDQFAVPVGGMVSIVVLAAVAGVVAAISPSRKAAKLNVLQAIVSE